ncbi:uncharacterized protein [Cherax quadricarinatus]|uniref:uncharacterized protein isoform X2 n=1 Tax=Cherax quadricarinatus TaxID=27406 RepID=UPI002378E6AF|nr:uncharacterized protein LOC128702093 isoform X1 [Cherax quadricarinatus]
MRTNESEVNTVLYDVVRCTSKLTSHITSRPATLFYVCGSDQPPVWILFGKNFIYLERKTCHVHGVIVQALNVAAAAPGIGIETEDGGGWRIHRVTHRNIVVDHRALEGMPEFHHVHCHL